MDKRILETILSDQAEELELIDKTVSICAFYVGLHHGAAVRATADN